MTVEKVDLGKGYQNPKRKLGVNTDEISYGECWSSTTPYKPSATHNSLIRSDEGLTLETSERIKELWVEPLDPLKNRCGGLCVGSSPTDSNKKVPFFSTG